MSCPEGYVTCPYDKYHQILVSRLQFHLVKCKRVYKGELKLIQCPFNTTHLIPEIEMNCHKMYTCPDRNKLETYIIAAQQTTPLFPVKPLEVECSENWDDAYHPTYDPMAKCKSQPVLVHFQCAPPSVRKQCRLEERERLAKFSSLDNSSQLQPNKSNQPVKSVRLPQTIPNTYFERNDRVETSSSKDANVNTGTIPKMFGRGRGRILQ